MKFEWEKDYPDSECYWTGKFYDDTGKCIDEISLTDNTCGYCREHYLIYNRKRVDTYEIHWCNGWSMSENLHKSEYDLDKAKQWCEKWMAERYIEAYEDTIKRLEEMKKTHDFWKQYIKEY